MDIKLKEFRTFITNLKESLTITKSHLEKISKKEPGKNLEEKGIDPNALRKFRREIQTFHDKINVLKQIISNPNQPIPIQKTQGISNRPIPPILPPPDHIIATGLQHLLQENITVQIVREKMDGGGLEWSNGWLLKDYNESNQTWSVELTDRFGVRIDYKENIPLENIAVLRKTMEFHHRLQDTTTIWQVPSLPPNHIIATEVDPNILQPGMPVQIVTTKYHEDGVTDWIKNCTLKSYNESTNTWTVKINKGYFDGENQYSHENVPLDYIAIESKTIEYLQTKIPEPKSGQVPPLLPPKDYIIATELATEQRNLLGKGMEVKIVRKKKNEEGFEWVTHLLDNYDDTNYTWSAHYLAGSNTSDYIYEENFPLHYIAVSIDILNQYHQY